MPPLSTPVPAKAREIEADVKGAGGREVSLFPYFQESEDGDVDHQPVLVKKKNLTWVIAAP